MTEFITTHFRIRRRLNTSLLIAAIGSLCWLPAELPAQLITDLQVEITELDGQFRYEYLLSTDFTSGFGANGFLLTVGIGAEIFGFDEPDGWVGEYTPDQVDSQVGWVSSFPGIVEIGPGDQGRFVISSNFRPGEQEYTIGKWTNAFDDIIDSVSGTILAPSQPPGDLESCDFNQDGACNLVDIDALGRHIALDTGNLLYDLTGDDLVNMSDLTAFLGHEQVNKIQGDLDFNGKVEFADFLILSANFGKPESARWSRGDLVPNFEVQFADFLVLSGNFGKASVAGAELAAVPEPTSFALISLCLAGFCHFTRRKGRKLPEVA